MGLGGRTHGTRERVGARQNSSGTLIFGMALENWIPADCGSVTFGSPIKLHVVTSYLNSEGKDSGARDGLA